MLMLSVLHGLLSQIISPNLHTAVLLTPSGELISYASKSQRPKDEIRIIVGLSGEVWLETKEQGYGMVDSELGRIIVLPVDDQFHDTEPTYPDGYQPMMLLTLNAAESVDWEELQIKGRTLSAHLAKSLSKFRDFIAISKTPSPATTAAASPAPPV